jgi:hypothetical protein
MHSPRGPFCQERIGSFSNWGLLRLFITSWVGLKETLFAIVSLSSTRFLKFTIAFGTEKLYAKRLLLSFVRNLFVSQSSRKTIIFLHSHKTTSGVDGLVNRSCILTPSHLYLV